MNVLICVCVCVCDNICMLTLYRVILGRTHVRSVAEERREELEHFLQQLLSLAPEISECDLIYTFFHPMLKDEQDAGKINLQKVRGIKDGFSYFIFYL